MEINKLTDIYRYLAIASAEKNIRNLIEIFGNAKDLDRSIETIHSHGGVKVLTETINLELANEVRLTSNFMLDLTDVSVLAKIYLNSIDVEWNEKYWLALQEDFPVSCEKIISLEFNLGPSPDKGETLGFHVFEFISEEMVIFDDAFRTLFIDSLWVSRTLLP